MCPLTDECTFWGETVDCKWTLVYRQDCGDEEVPWELLTPACEEGFSGAGPLTGTLV